MSNTQQDRPILPHEANKSVEMMFADLKEMDLLDKDQLFPGKLPQAQDMVRHSTFREKGPEDYGIFMAFIGECCLYHAIWVDNAKRGSKDKIFIPDEKEEEVDNLCWKYLKTQYEVYKKGKKQRMMVNAVCLPIPGQGNADTTGMDKPIKVFDTDVYFLRKEMMNSKYFETIIEGQGAIEYWHEQRPDGSERTFPLPRVKFWPKAGLTQEERDYYKKEAFSLDSFIREKLYSSLDNWSEHMASIERHLKAITNT